MNLKEMTNTELFRMYVENGSREAISQYFQNQADLFYRVAFKYTKNSADAEDVLQSSFLKIIDKANQYKGVKSDEEKLLQSWCLSIVIQCALMDRRTDSNRRKREDFTAAQAKPFYEDENMDTNNEMKAVHQKVQKAIIQLPEKYRIPIHLKYIEGFELETIAELLKLNINTLKSNIKRGLEKVSMQLKDEKVTLSSVGLIQLMATMPVEKAPVTIQSMASNIFSVGKNSSRLVSGSKSTSAFFTKAVSVVLATSIAVGASVYGLNLYRSNELQPKKVVEKPTVLNTKIEDTTVKPVVEKDTNETWLLLRQYVDKITILIGEPKYSEKLQGMFELMDKPIMFSIPINPQKKAFVLECTMAPYVNKEVTHSEVVFRGFWVKDNFMLRSEGYSAKEKYDIYGAGYHIQKLYFYDNHVFVFVNDKCYQVDKYSQDLIGANVAVFIKNFALQKVTSKTLEEPPKILLEIIEKNKSQKGVIQEKWFIDGKRLYFKD